MTEMSEYVGCQCSAYSGCGCTAPATTTDDDGLPVCEECAEYVVDEDGEVRCSRCEGVERVTETCGAGMQTRTYLRLAPPAMPDEAPDGGWACYWWTVGQDGRVVSRHATRDEAEQAVHAQDWPPPGDHTRYLCGYEVRVLMAGEWVRPSDE